MNHIRWTAALLLFLVACDGPPRRRDAGSDAFDPLGDRDRDRITDRDEGETVGRDSDRDGLFDFLDLDADGDGLTDAVEAGDADLRTPPRDSDGDGTPDVLDLDSDANGIPDHAEGIADTDGDAALDAHDADDDGDSLPDRDELVGISSVDTDGDGLPDHRDADSDGDTIRDGVERTSDTDRDGVPDFRDLDSDADGLLDALEGAEDTDRDGSLDFRDPDSDGDGLSDRDEASAHHTSPRAADSDGDLTSDLVEVSAGTDPLDATDNPRARGDFVFVLPFGEAPSPPRDTLIFRTRIQLADIYFLFDRSGSMAGEIGALRTAVTDVVGELTCGGSDGACSRDHECVAGELCSALGRCIEDPSTRGCIASPHTGVGHYLAEYTNVLGVQSDVARTSTALGFGVTGSTEALYRAAWGVAEPSLAPGAEGACVGTGIGCPGFRSDAVRILVTFTDEDSDGVERAEQAAAALVRAGITAIGVWAGSPTDPTRSDLVDLSAMSGSLDRDRRPLVFDGVDAAVVPAVARAIREVVEGVPLRVTIEASDEPGDDGDALPLLGALEARSERCGGATTEDADGDGLRDSYPAVTPGSAVCWDVVPHTNTIAPPTRAPQLFHARLTVRGDGSPLDARHVYLLVPPAPPVIEAPE